MIRESTRNVMSSTSPESGKSFAVNVQFCRASYSIRICVSASGRSSSRLVQLQHTLPAQLKACSS